MERQNEELVSLVRNEDGDEEDDHSFHHISNSPATMPPAYNDSEPLKIVAESVPVEQPTYVPASTVPKYSRGAYNVPAPQTSYNWQGIGSASAMNHVTAAPHIGPDPEAAAQAERDVGSCAVTRCSLVMLLLWAILVFFCCNWIGGLVALYFYREVRCFIYEV
jgi:hypothetical protein